MINKVTIPYHTISYRGYRRLQGVTKGYKGLKGGYRGLQGLQGLLGVTRGYGMVWYGNFIYTRYFLLVHLHSIVEKLIT